MSLDQITAIATCDMCGTQRTLIRGEKHVDRVGHVDIDAWRSDQTDWVERPDGLWMCANHPRAVT